MLSPSGGSDLSSLHTLSLAHCHAEDDDLRPVFAALASNTTLRTLFLEYNHLSEPFARDVVLPSLRANSALRRLALFDTYVDHHHADQDYERLSELLEAEALVAARR